MDNTGITQSPVQLFTNAIAELSDFDPGNGIYKIKVPRDLVRCKEGDTVEIHWDSFTTPPKYMKEDQPLKLIYNETRILTVGNMKRIHSRAFEEYEITLLIPGFELDQVRSPKDSEVHKVEITKETHNRIPTHLMSPWRTTLTPNKKGDYIVFRYNLSDNSIIQYYGLQHCEHGAIYSVFETLEKAVIMERKLNAQMSDMTISEMINSKRLRKLQISTNLISNMLEIGVIFEDFKVEIIAGLPENCIIVAAEFNEDYRSVDITFYHKSFPNNFKNDDVEIKFSKERIK